VRTAKGPPVWAGPSVPGKRRDAAPCARELSRRSGLEGAVLERSFIAVRKRPGVGAVDDPVVVGEARYIIERIAIDSLPNSSVTTTGRLTIAPVPRIATCGWLMIGVSNSAPLLPMLVMVNVPPESSSGADLVGAGAIGDVRDLAGDAGDVEVARLLDDRDEQALLGVHGDPRFSLPW
jgi:hypothetical protein